jgi:hypothetical protein
MGDKRFRDLEALFDKGQKEKSHGSDDRDRGEKLSWREKDRRRESSAHTDQSKEWRNGKDRPKDRYANAQAQKEQGEALAGLFASPEAKKLEKAIENADRAALQPALDAYFELEGRFPPNPDFLERALDTRKDRMLRDVVAAIEEALPDASPNRRKVLLRKMQSKARTTFDGPAAKHMKRLVEQHAADM